jgi:hypothetical protein
VWVAKRIDNLDAYLIFWLFQQNSSIKEIQQVVRQKRYDPIGFTLVYQENKYEKPLPLQGVQLLQKERIEIHVYLDFRFFSHFCAKSKRSRPAEK